MKVLPPNLTGGFLKSSIYPGSDRLGLDVSPRWLGGGYLGHGAEETTNSSTMALAGNGSSIHQWITSQKKSNGRNPKQLGRRLYFIKTRWFVSKAGCGLQHRAENGSSTSRNREPNNVLFFCSNPCFKIITCVLFSLPSLRQETGKCEKCSCECGSALDAGEDAGKLFILQSGTGAVCSGNGRYCSSQCRERCNALAALP